MFGKKVKSPTIDKSQIERVEYAQKRIKQKKQLYIHFVLFVIGSVFLFVLNHLLKIGETITPLGKPWYIFAVLIWLFAVVYHFITVFITNKFMNKAWEQQQLQKLVTLQEERITKLQQTIEKDRPLPKQLTATRAIKNNNITLIVACGEDNSIGKDNALIWHLSKDLKRFKKLTSGHHIIMGRKTFESFPKPLPNRTHIVITRQDNYKVPEGVIVVHCIEDAFDAARSDNQPYVIGGGEIYKQALPLAYKIELTKVHAKFPEADTFFPELDTKDWTLLKSETHKKDDIHNYDFSFNTYVKQ